MAVATETVLPQGGWWGLMSSDEDGARFSRFMIFLWLSILLHIVAFGVVFSSWFQNLQRKPVETPPPTITITHVKPKARPVVVPKKREKAFIDSEQLIKTDKKPDAARFESAANTIASSRDAPADGPADLPSQKGQKTPALYTRDTTYTPPNPNKPVPPQPKQQTVQKKPSQTQPERQKQLEKLLHKGKSFPLAREVPPIPHPVAPPSPPTPVTRQIETPTPASTFTMDRRRTAIQGGAALGGDSSVASQESILGRYKSKLYRAIGSRWYIYVQNRMSLLSVGQVKIRFFVRSNGVIEETKFTDGDSTSVLGTLSERAILDVGKMEPFPNDLKQRLGDGYWEEITFNIY